MPGRPEGRARETLGHLGRIRLCARLDRSGWALARIPDYHTIKGARKVDGKPGVHPIESRREYLCDAKFTIAMALKPSFPYSADRLKDALRAPVYTPFLGRRSCPLSRPLFEAVVSAPSLKEALKSTPPGAGVLYSEEPAEGAGKLAVRDVPDDRLPPPARVAVAKQPLGLPA